MRAAAIMRNMPERVNGIITRRGLEQVFGGNISG